MHSCPISKPFYYDMANCKIEDIDNVEGRVPEKERGRLTVVNTMKAHFIFLTIYSNQFTSYKFTEKRL